MFRCKENILIRMLDKTCVARVWFIGKIPTQLCSGVVITENRSTETQTKSRKQSLQNTNL